MQVGHATHNVRAIGMGKAAAFSLSSKDPGKIFDILIKYNNPILAVIREYTCNALDIHNTTGQTKPFLVVAPSQAEPMFRVRDYGTGLNRDEMEQIYCSYLNSTKDDDNNQIGGFGLGSKAGFGYADMFVVTSWNGGYKSVYNAYRGADRVPQLALASREESDEPAGLEVCIPVRLTDVSNFGWAMQSFLMHFEPGTYEPVGVIVTPFKSVLSGATWRTSSDLTGRVFSHSVSVPAKIKMGPVTYKVDWHQVGDSIAINNLIIDCPIGSCSLPFTREEVALDDATKEFLKKRLAEVRAEAINLMVKRDIEGAASLWEAAAAVAKNAEYLRIFGSTIDEVNYKGRAITIQRTHSTKDKPGVGRIVVQLPEDFEGEFASVEWSKIKNVTPKWHRSKKASFHPASDFIVIDDVSAKERNPYFWSRLQSNAQKINLRVRMIDLDHADGYIVPNLPNIRDLCGNPPDERVFLLSELTLPVGQSTTKKNVNADPIVWKRGNHGGYGASTWVQSRFKDERGSGVLFIPFKSSDPILTDWSAYKDLAWCSGRHVIGMTKRAVDEAAWEDAGMEEITAFVTRRTRQVMDAPDFVDRYTATVQYEKARGIADLDEMLHQPIADADALLTKLRDTYLALQATPRLPEADYYSLNKLVGMGLVELPKLKEHPIMAIAAKIKAGYPVFNWVISQSRFNRGVATDVQVAIKALVVKR